MTYDQQQMISIYFAGNRKDTIANLCDMRLHLTPEETELRQLTEDTVELLRRMDDEAFDRLDFIPTILF